MTFNLPHKPEAISDKHYQILKAIVQDKAALYSLDKYLSDSEFIQEFKEAIGSEMKNKIILSDDVAKFNIAANKYITAVAYDIIKFRKNRDQF